MTARAPAAITHRALGENQIEIAGALGNLFRQDLGALIDQRVDGALDNFTVGDHPPHNAGLGRAAGDHLLDLRIAVRRSAAGLVAIKASATLLAEAASSSVV